LLKGKTLYVINKPKEAKAVYEKVLELKPYNIEALRAMGNIAYSQENDFKTASVFYKKVLEIEPKDMTALIIVGTAAALQDDLDEAQQYLSRAIQQNPGFVGPYLRLGNILEAKDRVSAAFKIYRQILIANPTNNQAQAYFSSAAKKLKGEDGVLSAYKELAEEFPNAPDIQLLYAQQLLLNNKLDEAETVLKRTLEISPGKLTAVLAQGELLLKRKELKAAEELFQRLLTLEPNNANLYIQVAKLLIEQKQWNSAINYLEQAYKLQPDNNDIFVTLFESYYRQDQLDKAETILNQALEISKNKEGLYALLGALLRVQGKLTEALAAFEKAISLKPDNQEYYLQVISIHIQLKQMEKMEAVVNTAEEIFGKDKTRDFYYNLAVVYEQWGLYDRAVELLERVLKNDTQHLQAYTTLAHIYNLKREYSKAIETIKRARENLGSKADTPEFYLLEGGIYLEQRNYALAVDNFKTTLNKDPKNLLGMTQLISAYIYWRKYSQAETTLKLAKERFGMDNQEIVFLEAQLYTHQKKFEKAESILRELLKSEPESVDILYKLAGVYYEARDYEKAIAIFEKILTLEPIHIDALNSLGYTLAVMGKDLERAERYIRKALNFKPYAGYITDSLGWVYFMRGDYEKARELIEQAQRLELPDPEILEHLGDIAEKFSNREQAVNYWQQALELVPDNDILKKKIRRYKK
ncbi:MAG: tetratricopeptide repeat protein, partial [Candidatus Sumerlaeia bacterium]|nr:tetratricopeptide repeat protein [Candidatus Sumerlaeia bacterium]